MFVRKWYKYGFFINKHCRSSNGSVWEEATQLAHNEIIATESEANQPLSLQLWMTDMLIESIGLVCSTCRPNENQLMWMTRWHGTEWVVYLLIGTMLLFQIWPHVRDSFIALAANLSYASNGITYGVRKTYLFHIYRLIYIQWYLG